ncbi:ABC transporter ATP-binding protein [Jiella avicenniae]|uniref:Glutathione import ATP-binding protein GsiA n=1 Tax=Jiella avicenniae TaxID=2907202 RepID=A0A9X1T6G1_9HYPH|nr:ABC transporter ATP-binding protein [Jiella avicenniae]MCE7029335.1 ABC transporter ATP-binding protein [Jiella avicenniae]
MSEPIIRVENLEVSFFGQGTSQRVVHGVSFDIAPRETLALVGESGSGKSVTALAMMRLLPRETARITGRVSLAGRDLLAMSEAAMRGVRGNEIAMIFQEPMSSLNPALTVGDQISEVLVQHRAMSFREARAETLRLLDKARIAAAARRFREYPHQLSGGMRQRVMIAIALACRPKLLIADEPTTALDVTIQAQILALIEALREEEDLAVLFITHDMGVVAEIADRTAVMANGRVVEAGETAALFRAPREPYTRALLAAVPRLGSMRGTRLPARFPLVDPRTGKTDGTGEPVASPPAAETPLLRVRDLSARFDMASGFFGRVTGRVHAAENVSFDLFAGETLALVGESGCGKSTTGRAIMRLTEAASGKVELEGRDVLALKRAELRFLRERVQMIFQDPFASLDPRMRIGAAIAEPMLVHGLASREDARKKVAELLPRVGLDPAMAARYPHEFSGGQRQRICIARALALAPKLIVADEAVSALDVSIKAQVINLMLDLQQDFGLAFLFISHDMAVVERIAHRVAVMYLGEIVEIGPRAAIFENPQHPCTRRLLAAVPIPDPARKGLRRVIDETEVKNPIRPVDHVPPLRQWRTVSPGHEVQVFGKEWHDRPGAA